jgi:hypothetical protein
MKYNTIYEIECNVVNNECDSHFRIYPCENLNWLIETVLDAGFKRIKVKDEFENDEELWICPFCLNNESLKELKFEIGLKDITLSKEYIINNMY